ncbi:MAG: aldehyde dehydrogenase family protein, partial [Flavobacteriales bacterium]
MTDESLRSIAVRNPRSGDIDYHVACLSAEAVSSRVDALKQNQTAWQDLGAKGRAAVLYRFAAALASESDSLSEQLAIDTGRFTGRSPQDRFIVQDNITTDEVWWGDINQPISTDHAARLHEDLLAYLDGKGLYARDAFVGAHPEHRRALRVLTEKAWSNLFASNMFLRPTQEEVAHFTPEWHILCAPGFKADPDIHGTRQSNFAVLDFTHKRILIGGTGYTGEIKKGMFSAMNFLLPTEADVLPMHCSANEGLDGKTAVFFGLSGTGKTTL